MLKDLQGNKVQHFNENIRSVTCKNKTNLSGVIVQDDQDGTHWLIPKECCHLKYYPGADIAQEEAAIIYDEDNAAFPMEPVLVVEVEVLPSG